MHLFTREGSILKLQSQLAQCQGGGAHGFNYLMDLSTPKRRNLELYVPVCNTQGKALDSMGKGVINFPHTWGLCQPYMF